MVKLLMNGNCCVPAEKRAENAAYAKSLGLPYVCVKERPPLIVLGGGHSISEYVGEVRGSNSDRWIIGSSFSWWTMQGIGGTFFSVHPSPNAIKNIRGVKRAILATVTDPSVIDALLTQGAEVEFFDADHAGSTTATAAPYLAVCAGYSDVTFYGCDSSYVGIDDRFLSHPYMSEEDVFLMRVKCNGEEFLTGAEFLMQAEFLVAIIRAKPDVFKEKSGGLLRAMLADPDVDTLAVSKTIYAGTGLAA